MIVDYPVLLGFVPAALALNLTPGADMLFCIGQGLKGGPRAALAADAGIALGGMVHVALAGLGLGAAVAAAPWLFEVIRWLGVGYLLWLAVATLRAGAGARPRAGTVQAGDTAPIRPARAFLDGLLVNLTNPKVILFVLAFVPQFVVPDRAVLPQFLIFGVILSAGGLVVNGLLGVFAGSFGQRLTGSPRAALWLGRVSAAVFLGLAARLAMISRA